MKNLFWFLINVNMCLGIVGDRFFWFSDVEFARETLAGANPYSIQLVKAWTLLQINIYFTPYTITYMFNNFQFFFLFI